MSAAPDIVERLFLAIWEISWQASLLALLVLAAQWLFRGKLNPRWKSVLWMVVLARLILPVVPENPWSVQQVLPTPQFMQTVNASPSVPHEAFPAASDPVPTISSGWNLSLLFSRVWLAGVMIGGIIMLWSNLRFIRTIRRLPEIRGSRLNVALAECCLRLGLDSPPRMAVTDHVLVPAVMGFWKPVLLLPEDAALRYTDGELRHIFLHELAHLRRGDHQIQWLIALLHLLHWFNPVLALAFRRMRTDREPAADALALSCAGQSERESYGLALVKVLETRPPRPALPLAVGILEDNAHLASRFRLISSFTPKAYAWSLLGAVLLGVLAVFGLSRPEKAASPAPAETGLIRLETKMLEFELPDSQAEIDRISALLDRVDLEKILSLPKLDVVTAPSVTVRENMPVQITLARDFRFPVQYEAKPGQAPAPSKYENVEIGLILDATARSTSSGILVSGTMTLRQVDGQNSGEANILSGLSFTTKEFRFSALLQDGQPTAIKHGFSDTPPKKGVLLLTASREAPSKGNASQ